MLKLQTNFVVDIYWKINTQKINESFEGMTRWCSVYHYCTSSFNKAWTYLLRRFKSDGEDDEDDSRWWGSLTMVLAGHKSKCLSSVNHNAKTNRHHHYRHHHHYKQYGFCKGFSAAHGINYLIDNIERAIDNKQFVCGIFIDLQKVFNTVYHNISRFLHLKK